MMPWIDTTHFGVAATTMLGVQGLRSRLPITGLLHFESGFQLASFVLNEINVRESFRTVELISSSSLE